MSRGLYCGAGVKAASANFVREAFIFVTSLACATHFDLHDVIILMDGWDFFWDREIYSLHLLQMIQ